MKIDLDAARAARREASGEPPVVVFDGKELTLPLEIPFAVAERMGTMGQALENKDGNELSNGFKEVLQLLLGDNFEDFMSSKPSVPDLMALVEGVVKAYGFADVGESQASAT